jgi:hypothetical protein
MPSLHISGEPCHYRIFEWAYQEPVAEFVGALLASDGRDCLYQDWRDRLHFAWFATVEEGEFTTLIHCECYWCGTDFADLRANARDWISQVCEGQPPRLLL